MTYWMLVRTALIPMAILLLVHPDGFPFLFRGLYADMLRWCATRAARAAERNRQVLDAAEQWGLSLSAMGAAANRKAGAPPLEGRLHGVLARRVQRARGAPHAKRCPGPHWAIACRQRRAQPSPRTPRLPCARVVAGRYGIACVIRRVRGPLAAGARRSGHDPAPADRFVLPCLGARARGAARIPPPSSPPGGDAPLIGKGGRPHGLCRHARQRYAG